MDDRIFYVESLRALWKSEDGKSLRTIDQFSKGARPLLKGLSVTSPHANNEPSERNIEKRTSFTFKSKIFSNSPNQRHERQIIKINETNKWRLKIEVHLCSWIGKLNIVKMVTLSNVFNRVSATLIKIPLSFLVRIGKQHKNPHRFFKILVTIILKNNKAKGIPSDIKTYD